MTDEHGFVAIGGHAEDLDGAPSKAATRQGWDLADGRPRRRSRCSASPESRTIEADAIEAGVLDRTRSHRRKFRRLEEPEIAAILAG